MRLRVAPVSLGGALDEADPLPSDLVQGAKQGAKRRLSHQPQHFFPGCGGSENKSRSREYLPNLVKSAYVEDCVVFADTAVALSFQRSLTPVGFSPADEPWPRRQDQPLEV